jgi:hypothetical protein
VVDGEWCRFERAPELRVDLKRTCLEPIGTSHLGEEETLRSPEIERVASEAVRIAFGFLAARQRCELGWSST